MRRLLPMKSGARFWGPRLRMKPSGMIYSIRRTARTSESLISSYTSAT
jgi:hypothetical protein